MSNIALFGIIFIITLSIVLIAGLIWAGVYNRKHKTISAGAYVWEDRKHTFLGLPISFTVYALSPDRLFIRTGFLNTVENEVRLYRVLDIQLRENLFQKILGLGSIVLKTSDKSMHNFTILNVGHAKRVKELLSEAVEVQRRNNRVMGREFMDYDESDDDTE